MSAKQVLLVEDHPANVLVAKTLLNMFGYDCTVAKSGEEALQHIEQNQFHVALMDVQLDGELCGIETTKRVRDREKGEGVKRLPIIAMTASGWGDDRQRCLEAGMDDYISKPFDPEALREKIERVAA